MLQLFYMGICKLIFIFFWPHDQSHTSHSTAHGALTTAAWPEHCCCFSPGFPAETWDGDTSLFVAGGSSWVLEMSGCHSRIFIEGAGWNQILAPACHWIQLPGLGTVCCQASTVSIYCQAMTGTISSDWVSQWCYFISSQVWQSGQHFLPQYLPRLTCRVMLVILILDKATPTHLHTYHAEH